MHNFLGANLSTFFLHFDAKIFKRIYVFSPFSGRYLCYQKACNTGRKIAKTIFCSNTGGGGGLTLYFKIKTTEKKKNFF